MEHLTVEQRESLVTVIRIASDYFCEFATDADLFALQAVLCNQASQLALRLSRAENPSDGPYPSEQGLATMGRTYG